MSIARTDKVAQQRSRTIRRVVLAATLVITTAISLAHQLVQNAAKPVGVDALCPFGGLETVYSLIAGDGFVKRAAASSVVLLVLTLGMTLVARRSFCGQLCPLGALQGFFGWIRSRILPKRFEIPKAVDRVARYLKYVVLVVFLAWTWQAADLVMRPFDPWVAWAHLTSAEVITEFYIGLAVLGVSLAGSFLYDRFFCKYLCPTGAFLGLFSRVSVFGIKRDPHTCIDCGKCDQACPMNINVSTQDQVTSAECISCSECVNACPVSGALAVQPPAALGPSRSGVRPIVITMAVVVMLVSGVGIGRAVGYFDPVKATLEQEVEHAGGDFDTSLIKGSTPLSQISEATGIPRAEFTARFGVPDADLDKPMSQVKTEYDFTPDDVRTWVAEKIGIEPTLEEDHEGDEHEE